MFLLLFLFFAVVVIVVTVTVIVATVTVIVVNVTTAVVVVAFAVVASKFSSCCCLCCSLKPSIVYQIWNHPDILKSYLDSKKNTNRNDSPLVSIVMYIYIEYIDLAGLKFLELPTKRYLK